MTSIAKVPGRKVIMVPAPFFVISFIAGIFDRFKWFPAGKDQLNDLVRGNVCDSTELFEKLSLLLNNPEKSKEMGKKGRNFVKDNFNLDKICNDFLNHLKKHGIGDI